MKSFFILSFYLFILGMIGFLTHHKHLLTMLIMMEFMVLGILVLLAFFLSNFITSWVMLLLIFFLVCESVVGLSCIILLARAQGDQFISSLSLMKC